MSKSMFNKPQTSEAVVDNSWCAHPGCQRKGTVTTTTHPNEKTKWYCSQHFFKENYFEFKTFNPVEKAEVLASVKYRGPLRWAHEIIALNDAGLYNSLSGLESARKVLGMDKQNATV